MNLKDMVFELCDFNFTGGIEEKDADGVYVCYDGKNAVVGGGTIPEKCRAYTLLAKNIKEGRKSFEISQKPAFKTVGAMLDMSRGGVMRAESVKKYIKYLAAHGMNMLMLYTEDTYEVEKYPYLGYQRGRYTLSELREIDDFAYSLGVEVIPCIQTLGHMEQFLHHSVNYEISDGARTLLIGDERTYAFIDECISTMRKAFRSKRIHVGCDETNELGRGRYLDLNGYRNVFEIYTEHLERVCEICRKYDFHPMIWSDMYFTFSQPLVAETYQVGIEVPQFAIDAMPEGLDMVFWDYYHTNSEFYRENIKIHKSFNRKTIFGGGIWTWDGFVPNYTHTYNTMKPALEECLDGGIDEVIATVWSNNGCETSQFLSVPMLSMFSEYCWLGKDCTEEDIWSMSNLFTGMTRELADAVSDFFFREDGAIRAGKHVLWSDPLINIICFDINFDGGIEYLKNGLKTFEKYNDFKYIEYFKAVFRACLDKCIIQTQLRKKYKEGDRDFLRDFAENVLPKMIADFENLFAIHKKIWFNDYKAQGFERISIRYDGTIGRMRYAAETILRYLDGEISAIEELEPEIIRGVKTKWLGASDSMLTSCDGCI